MRCRHVELRKWCCTGLAVVGGAITFIASPAEAHIGTGLPGGLLAGFEHPLSGLDHLLAMISVGLWGAFLGRPLIYALPVIFPVVMVVGAGAGMHEIPMPSVEIGIALSVLVLGGCIAMSFNAPSWVAISIVATFAVFHGYAHGRELPSAADPVGFATGFVFATGLLHVAGIIVGRLRNHHKGTATIRALGVMIAGTGAWFLNRAIWP
ncbi:MAG: HupE/UreJ family protein [Pseudomonadota bacterium]